MNTKFRLENNYDIKPQESWIRVKNPLEYYETTVGLSQISEFVYQYRISGYFRPIINNIPKIIRKDTVDFFSKYVPNQFEIEPIKIIRKSTNEIWSDYYIIQLNKSYKNTDYELIECSGLQIFSIEHEIYVSEKMKNLFNLEFNSNEIRFSEGTILKA